MKSACILLFGMVLKYHGLSAVTDSAVADAVMAGILWISYIVPAILEVLL